jgi:hypothetical protein
MKNREFRNVRELAKAVGCSRSAISRYTKHPEWTFGSAPWLKSLLPAIKKFRAAWISRGSDQIKKAKSTSTKIITDPAILETKAPDDLKKILDAIRAAGNVVEAEMALKRVRAYRLWREETQRSGKLVNADSIRPQIARVFSLFRSCVLEMPRRVNDSLEGLNSFERLSKLDDEARNLLRELAASFGRIVGVPNLSDEKDGATVGEQKPALV